jgi:hypothetical protein
VPRRFSWLQPFDGYAEFHDVGLGPPPTRSRWPATVRGVARRDCAREPDCRRHCRVRLWNARLGRVSPAPRSRRHLRCYADHLPGSVHLRLARVPGASYALGNTTVMCDDDGLYNRRPKHRFHSAAGFDTPVGYEKLEQFEPPEADRCPRNCMRTAMWRELIDPALRACSSPRRGRRWMPSRRTGSDAYLKGLWTPAWTPRTRSST